MTRLQSKTCGCEKKNEKKNLTYKERLMGYNCKQDVWSEKKKKKSSSWLDESVTFFFFFDKCESVTYYNF